MEGKAQKQRRRPGNLPEMQVIGPNPDLPQGNLWGWGRETPSGTWMLAGSPLHFPCSVPFENDGSLALLKGLRLCFKLEATGGLGAEG